MQTAVSAVFLVCTALQVPNAFDKPMWLWWV
jgi:hypothetical protein